MHDDKEVDMKSIKPEIILFYDSTKGAVDTVDQLCHLYSVQFLLLHTIISFAN